jgi:hypothetical protein
MSRIITYLIDDCFGCPYLTDWSFEEDADSYCAKEERHFLYPDTRFPEWCPLEEKNDGQEVLI